MEIIVNPVVCRDAKSIMTWETKQMWYDRGMVDTPLVHPIYKCSCHTINVALNVSCEIWCLATLTTIVVQSI